MSEIDIIIANIKDNYDHMMRNLDGTLEKFNSFCRETDSKITSLDERVNAHERLHQELKEQQEKFEERLAKRSSKQLTIVTIIIAVISIISGIIIKLL